VAAGAAEVEEEDVVRTALDEVVTGADVMTTELELDDVFETELDEEVETTGTELELLDETEAMDEMLVEIALLDVMQEVLVLFTVVGATLVLEDWEDPESQFQPQIHHP
jgi:hypothetical protein